MNSIKTTYLSAVSPPGPFVSVGVAKRDGSAVVPNCGAQVDTAADWTVLPQPLADRLGLTPTREVELTGFGGIPSRCPVFEVWVMFPTFQPVLIEVTAKANEPWILLGRDVLNRYQILLDGPALQVTITEP